MNDACLFPRGIGIVSSADFIPPGCGLKSYFCQSGAVRRKPNMIVMGAKNNSVLHHLVAGSVAADVMKNTGAPVVLIPIAVDLKKTNRPSLDGRRLLKKTLFSENERNKTLKFQLDHYHRRRDVGFNLRQYNFLEGKI